MQKQLQLAMFPSQHLKQMTIPFTSKTNMHETWMQQGHAE